MMLSLVGEALWFILPAYFANASPVIFGGGRPIDGGRKFRDGRPIFGPGKTVRGFLGGLSVGTIIGGFQTLTTNDLELLPLAFLLSLGALCGDLFGSFVKRRLGFERGRPFPLLDQLGFLLFAVICFAITCSISFDFHHSSSNNSNHSSASQLFCLFTWTEKRAILKYKFFEKPIFISKA
ncbi:MAG: CDP-2,3-bis-(O-geranylgeranyl)-sn-glycerol synthase [Candidatus Hadarchaeales archaeon]